MGFVLIPNIGVSNINIGLTLALIIMSIFARENRDKKYIYKTIAFICIMLILLLLGKWIFKQKNPDILIDTDSQYSRIWVKQIATEKATYKTIVEKNIVKFTSRYRIGIIYRCRNWSNGSKIFEIL